MKRIGSAGDLLKEGTFHQNHKRLPEAYQLYLEAAQAAVHELTVHPGFALLKTARDALNGAEEILNILARESLEEEQQSSVGGEVLTPAPMPKMVIPLSPLVKALQLHQARLAEAEKSYSMALALDPPSDLKELRALLQDVEVEKLQVAKVGSQIESCKTAPCFAWDPAAVAQHISRISGSLYGKINAAHDVLVPSLEKINVPLWRFLAFQEYVFSIFMLACEPASLKLDKDGTTKTMDFLVALAQHLLYKDQNIASFSGIMQVLERQSSLLSFCSPVSKIMAEKLQDVYGDGSIDIHAELLQDMIKAHPNQVIIPSLSSFVRVSTHLQRTSPPHEREAFMLKFYLDLLASSQPGARRSTVDTGSTNEVLLHWILSRTYLETYCRPFWKQIIECASINVPVLIEEEPAKDSKTLPSPSQNKEAAIPDPAAKPQDSATDPADDIVKRLAALRGK
ncbi:hypothetical protein HDV03_000541 [Kappamyces sp. JEL0829]|nr:hypothetical protein HDV03_000541 [Kappamyces sp. JEL0829]